MKLLLAAALAFAVACTTPAPSSGTRGKPATTEIEAVVRAQEAAWNRGDVEGFMSAGYWRSPDLTFYSGGDVTHGFEPVLARYVKRYKTGDAEMGKLAFTALEVVPLSDDAAIVRGRWDLDFDKQADVGGLFTLVFRHMKEGWRIVHDHTSVAK
jgi:beta-aspartyl-peptidase (threonine type)